MLPNSTHRYRLGSAALILVAFVFRAWFMTTLSLSGDEAYHWQWSRHLAAGYHDHPGMAAWMIWLSTAACGSSTEFSVRLPALLCLAGVWCVFWAFARRVVLRRGGSMVMAERAGLLAVVFVVFAPVTAVFSVYMSTDPPLLLFWSLGLYLLFRAFESGWWRHWIGGGVALGLAISSKFLALLLLPAAALYLLVSRKHRERLNWGAAAAAAVAAGVCLVPLLWWNAENDWATFKFNFVGRHGKHHSSWRHPPSYAAAQLALLSPGLAILGVMGIVQAWREWTRERVRSSLFLCLVSVVPLVAFLYVSFSRRVGGHWPTAGWFGCLIYVAASYGLGKGWTTTRGGRRLLRWAIGIAVGLTLFMHVLAHIPQRYLTFDIQWFDRPHAIRLKALEERFGWEELGRAVGQARSEMRAETGREVFLAATKYGVASSVAFYVPGHAATHLWCEPRNHGDNYRHWYDYSDLAGQDAIYVIKRDVQDRLPTMRAHFARVAPPEELPIVIDGFKVRSFFLVRCYQFDGREPFPRGL